MKVVVVSDVVCPWCRIGKTNLQAAARQFTQTTGEQVQISFMPYLLDPITPEEEGVGYQERFLVNKGISAEQMRQMFDRVTQIGGQFGLKFNFDAIKEAANTVPAHELMELAPEDRRWDLMDALMTAWFEHGVNIGDMDELVRIATEVLGPETAAQLEASLRSRAMEPIVMNMIRQVQQMGIRGVPFTIVNDTYGVNGGQPPQVFLDTLMKAYEAQQAESGSEVGQP